MKLGSAIASTCLPYTIATTHRRLLPLSLPSPHSPSRPSNSLHTTMSQFLAPTAQVSSPTTTASDGSHPMSNPQPWLIVGLGNPGKKYWGTRHNLGFEMVDFIAEAEGTPISSVNFKALFGKGFIGNVPVMLAKPQTYMNLSGESVGAIVSYYEIPLKQVLVICLLPNCDYYQKVDMVDITGIGRPPGKMDAASFVLHPFTKQEHQELDFTFQQGVEAVRILLLEG